MQTLLPYFSATMRDTLSALAAKLPHRLQEIRVREGRPLEVLWGTGHSFVTGAGSLTSQPSEAYRPTRQDCAVLLELLTQHSLYTFEEELKRGFITVQGGHRVGLTGRAIVEQGKVKYIKDVSGFNVRIACEWKGTGQAVLPYLIDTRLGHVCRTLIISPPQRGKTTLLRDLARLLGGGSTSSESSLARSYKVGIVDERSEIAACVRGVPTFDVGPRTDVLDGCPKAEGMMMLIRSMSPEVLMADEIGRAEDAAALHEAVHAGISVIATAHGTDVEDVRRRPILRELLSEGVFDRFVVLSAGRESGQPAAAPSFAVYDGQGKRLDERLALRGSVSL